MSARRKLSKAYRKLVSNPAAGPTKIQRKPSLTTSVCAPPKITSIDLSEKKEKIQGKIQDKIQVPTITETPTPIMPPTSNSTPRHLPPRSLTCNEISSSPPLTPPRSPAMLREQHQDLIAAQLIRNHQERLETLVTTIVVAYRTFIAPNPALQFLLLSFFGLVSLPTVAFTAFVILTTGFNTVLGVLSVLPFLLSLWSLAFIPYLLLLLPNLLIALGITASYAIWAYGFQKWTKFAAEIFDAAQRLNSPKRFAG